MKKIRLKGGSLSGTYLCLPENSQAFVRKEVSLRSNREYGFQRWCSQLKRIQRYSHFFPGVFPRLITYGQNADMAYFDMEYIEDSVTVQEFLIQTTDKSKIDSLLNELITVMGKMHHIEIPSTMSPLDLYIFEEMEQKMLACRDNEKFQKFIQYSHLYFNGEKVPALASVLEVYKDLAKKVYSYTKETFTHGNLTLENILYQPKTGRIIFIDPYEENIIDSVLAEYSQIYQSCNSKYELYNAGSPIIEANRVELSLPSCEGLDYFNLKFTEFLMDRYSLNDILMVRLLEVSQFIRMLPFKMEIAEDKMLFFYTLGSYLFHKVRENGIK